MALAERTWERVGERKRDRARLIESAAVYHELSSLLLLYDNGVIFPNIRLITEMHAIAGTHFDRS